MAKRKPVRKQTKRKPVKQKAHKPRIFRDARGRFVSKAEHEAGRKLRKAARGERKPKKLPVARPGGSKKSRRPGRSTGRKYRLPKPKTHELIGGFDKRLYRARHAEDARAIIIALADQYRDKLMIQVSIGTGFGADSQWISSTLDEASAGTRYLNRWQHRKSAEPIIDGLDGEEPWFEIHAIITLNT